jgi:hypothetical protein
LENPEVPRARSRETVGEEEREGNVRGERPFAEARDGEDPRGEKAQESKRPCPHLNREGSNEMGTAFPVGGKRWSAGTWLRGYVGKRRSVETDAKACVDHGKGEKL